ncbi:MAG: hypothetical protein JSV04_09240, partial [Candidatus Heimdallarchaeota archaeon]
MKKDKNAITSVEFESFLRQLKPLVTLLQEDIKTKVELFQKDPEGSSEEISELILHLKNSLKSTSTLKITKEITGRITLNSLLKMILHKYLIDHNHSSDILIEVFKTRYDSISPPKNSISGLKSLLYNYNFNRFTNYQ